MKFISKLRKLAGAAGNENQIITVFGEELGKFISNSTGRAGDESSLVHSCQPFRSTKKKGVPRKPARLSNCLSNLHASHGWFNLVDRVPRRRRLQAFIDVIDIFHSFGLQPFAEGFCALLCVNWDSVFPRRAAAENSVELDA